MKEVFGIVFVAALIGVSAALTSCKLDKQFLVFQLDCEKCDDPTATIGVNGTICCHAITGDVNVSDSKNVSCCKDIQPPVFGLTTCEITSDCYQRFYGKALADLSLYVNGTKEDFVSCTALTINTTPAYKASTSCANCNATTPAPDSSSDANIPSLLFITICQLLWIGFAS